MCRVAPPKGFDGVRGLNGLFAELVELDWYGNTVWEYRHNMIHHDYERLSIGHTLALQWERMPEAVSRRIKVGTIAKMIPDGCSAM